MASLDFPQLAKSMFEIASLWDETSEKHEVL